MEDIIIEELRRFLSETGYVNNDSPISKDQSLLKSGLIDLVVVVQVSEFMASKYNLKVFSQDLVAENFDTLSNMADFVKKSQLNSEEQHEWFDNNAEMFAGAIAIELPFLGLDPIAQARLNEYKLYALTHDQLVNWKDCDVLEFGAGHGRFAIELQGYRSYLGLDFAANLVEIGHQRIRSMNLQDRARLVVGDCLEYEGEENSHDLVCCLGMLPYVEDYAKVIDKMTYHTKPGGMVLVDFRHATPLYSLLRQIKWRLFPQTGGCSVAHTKAQLHQTFAKAGLTDIRFMMREYPFLDTWYAKRNWDWPLQFRQLLAHRSWMDWTGMIGFAAARKPV